ncbi:MAG: peptidylprolyl isomerase [Defluviitaleaceae bacterium]|nr:peptidylprolyl isomerase [Defluviitaleaceae bacterium]
MSNPKVKIEMENGAKMTLELYPEIAPISVENFVNLAGQGFYNGLIFHRVIQGFMIQGGCPNGSGMGGPGHQIKGEFAKNSVENPIVHEAGVISMARSQDMDSAGSQFFIVHQAAPHLDGSYAAFGRIVDGMDVVNQIAQTPTDHSDRPLEEQKIKSITILEN